MDTLITDEFMFVQAIENDSFKTLIDDFDKEHLTYYMVEPGRTFNKADSEESICHIIFIRYGGIHDYEDIEEIVKRHRKTVINYSEYNIILKFVIAFAEMEYDQNMNCNITYSEEDVIGKYDTYEEVEKAFEIVCRVYQGTEPILLIEEYYYYDPDGKPFLICRESPELCYLAPEETYSIFSASIIDLSEENHQLTCTLDKKLFEYYSLEDAKEAFEALQAVYADPEMIPVLVKRYHKLTRNGENKLVKEEVIDFIEEC